jgi:hypothetical protein
VYENKGSAENGLDQSGDIDENKRINGKTVARPEFY